MAFGRTGSLGALVTAAVVAAFTAGQAQSTRVAVGPVSAPMATQGQMCSVMSITGEYGWSYTGFVVDEQGFSTPTNMVGNFTFDGLGGISDVSRTVNVGGVVQSQVGSGSYAISPNCSGTATIILSTVGQGGVLTPAGAEIFDFVFPQLDTSEFKFTITSALDPEGLKRRINIVALGSLQSFF